jgi:hypothetical protein
MKMKVKQLRSIVKEEASRIVESGALGRGIPDFAVKEIARSCSDNARQRILVHINQVASDPKRRRQLLAEATTVLTEIEEEVEELLREKLSSYMRNT